MPEPLSVLDKQLEDFECLAREYHRKKTLKITDPKKLAKHQEELDSCLAHLESQRRDIDVQAQIQEELEIYRKGNRPINNECKQLRAARVAGLESEEYHPTDDLQKNMLAAGLASPDQYCSCHHIVPGHGRMTKDKVTGEQSRSRNAIAARTKLHQMGIGINDADNGVWLPKGMTYVPHWAMEKALPHSRIHTKRYEAHIASQLKNTSNEQQARDALDRVRIGLQQGSLKHLLTDESQATYLQKTA
ncbi:AHH domain-containing protein [Microbulbifer epialgicus]|uniref:AHH domain-containing protein n=1 Tax=Microbulbifer epialgicus TaxID=393907 RepID=A0ABV4P5J9_9GAMM